jgi:hypothetical protein
VKSLRPGMLLVEVPSSKVEQRLGGGQIVVLDSCPLVVWAEQGVRRFPGEVDTPVNQAR